MRKLSDTLIFSELDAKLGITKEIKKINLSSSVLPTSSIDEYYNIINRRYNYTLKFRVLDDFRTGNINLYSDKNVNITKIIPIFNIGNNSSITSYINADAYGSYNEDSQLLTIDIRNLYALMQNATVNRAILQNPVIYSSNIAVSKLGAIIYSKLFAKVLDKLYGIALKPIMADKIRYMLGKFFCIYILQRADNDTTNNIALNCCVTPSTSANYIVSSMEEVEASLQPYESIPNLLKAIEDIGGIAKVDLRKVMENWMIMYGESAVMGMEYFPALLDMIFATMVSANINKTFVIEGLVGKETISLYTEVARLMR